MTLRCVITGATGTIGAALVRGLADASWSMVIVGRDPDRVGRLVDEVGPQYASTTGHAVDLGSRTGISRLAEQLADSEGERTILINCAATQMPIGPLIRNPMDSWHRAIVVNLVAPAILAHALIPGMVRVGFGRIISMSGGGAVRGRPNFSAYAASKAAVVRLTETLAGELSGTGVTVNAVAPGQIRSSMTSEVLRAGSLAGDAELHESSAISRAGDSLTDVVDLVRFLISDFAQDLTGRLISAVHDPWREWAGRGWDLSQTDLYTLRRIDPFTINKARDA